jgi:hypothetical protein
MSNEDLRALLAELHTRLNHADTLDADTRTLLKITASDIETTMARGQATAATHEPLLEALAVKFEADHPAVAAVLRQIIDVLGKAGV